MKNHLTIKAFLISISAVIVSLLTLYILFYLFLMLLNWLNIFPEPSASTLLISQIVFWISGFVAGYICSKISFSISSSKESRIKACYLNVTIVCIIIYLSSQSIVQSNTGVWPSFSISSLIIYTFIFLGAVTYIKTTKHDNTLNKDATSVAPIN